METMEKKFYFLVCSLSLSPFDFQQNYFPRISLYLIQKKNNRNFMSYSSYREYKRVGCFLLLLLFVVRSLCSDIQGFPFESATILCLSPAPFLSLVLRNRIECCLEILRMACVFASFSSLCRRCCCCDLMGFPVMLYVLGCAKSNI